MTPRETIAHEFARRNKARVDNARAFRAELAKLVTVFYQNDAILRRRIQAIETDELELPIAAPEDITDAASFLEVIDRFIEELEDVNAREVLDEAREYDAQDRDDDAAL